MPISGSYFYAVMQSPTVGSFPTDGSDNSLVKFDSSSRRLQSTNVVIGDGDEISGYRGAINRQTADYNLTMADSGKIVEMSGASLLTVFLPNFLSAGFGCTVSTVGSSQVLFSASTGAVLRSYTNLSKSAGQNAVCSVYVTTNSNGTSAVYILGGNIA